jgi:hypothetical protein
VNLDPETMTCAGRNLGKALKQQHAARPRSSRPEACDTPARIEIPTRAAEPALMARRRIGDPLEVTSAQE